MNSILNSYNYIEADTLFVDRKEWVPVWPGSPFFYQMPQDMLKNYHLQNPRIKSKEKEYLKGFSMSLLYLYSKLIPDQINKFKKDMLNVKTWLELHAIGDKIRKITGYEPLVKLFKMCRKMKRKAFKKRVIKSLKELKMIFRGRDIRVITDRFSGDYPNTWALFLHVFFGAVGMYKLGRRTKPEIIEFKQIYNNGDWIEYSYAIYIPVGGMLWDSSHWIIFDKLCVESLFEPSCYFKCFIDNITKIFRNDIYLSRYEIEGDLLKRYIEKNDRELKRKKLKMEQFKTCKGLLGEFLAGLYLIKEKGVANLVRLDFHKSLRTTDIDVIGETEDTIIIFQVKTNLSFNPEEHKKILENFRKAIRSIDIKNKKVRKILFVLNEQVLDSIFLIDEEALRKGPVSIDVKTLESKKWELIQFFKKKDIEVVFLKNLKDMLEKKHQYGDFLNKLNIIFVEGENFENFDEDF